MPKYHSFNLVLSIANTKQMHYEWIKTNKMGIISIRVDFNYINKFER